MALEIILRAAVDIRQEPDNFDIAFLARELVQCTLPHTDPGPVPAWSRINGAFALGIQPGWNHAKNRSLGIPFGSIPRLLIYWMNTEAVRTGQRRLELGDTFASFLRQLGLDPRGGGPRSDHKRLQNQMRRLFSSSITFQQSLVRNGLEGERRVDMQVASESELWWDPKNPGQAGLLGSWLELGEKFYTSITASPVPGDIRAIRALKRSPLALDMYVWCTHKAWSAATKNRAIYASWDDLVKAFGSDYADRKNFQQKLIKRLRAIRLVYPGLELESQKGGIAILPTSRPAIPPRLIGYRGPA